ncbi:1-acyl-sn-glycerol-3-phosphate acyltransferase [Prolixibacteraceae bacterium Z1-6]|uniref:1-acyl-sn-glycerol-3-phosphate acyltransferase n=1 Tax=Draconibacterium aestuarii TaxID=2998507 RepID=A0A9X3F9U6_9BACT|nr:1-acyl-sn-glycerol-3-phosphate acyltransferase [Prolixibacteraceae bacterium Z1-6]
MKYEKWSRGYWCLKQYVRFIDWIIHKKVILNGTENIPPSKPILFAPNHQNALSDPMAILLHTRFQPVWLARADIFKEGIITLILRFLKIMPVYRMRDGKDQLAKNDKTFADSIKVLENNFALALFPEAAHSSKRQMLAHKKAVPRIVFMAEEKAKQNLDIHIVPVGICYSSYWKFNRTVIVNFGQPILVNDFLEEYTTNVSSATMALRDSICHAIDGLTINIKSKEHYAGFELIREIYGNHFLKRQGKKFSDVNLLTSDRVLTQKLDALELENPDTISAIVNETKTYNSLVRKYKLRNWLIENPGNNLLKIVGNKLILLLGLPIFLFGFVFNAIPFFITDIFVRKKIKDFAFWSTFFLGSGIVLFPIVYLLELGVVSTFIPGFWLKLLTLIAMPITGKIAFRWYIVWLKSWGRGRLFFLKLLNKKRYFDLQNKQKQLFEKLDQLI